MVEAISRSTRWGAVSLRKTTRLGAQATGSSQRSIYMSVVEQRQVRPVEMPAALESAVVIAEGIAQKRIVATLAAHDIKPLAQIESPAVLGGLDLEESTILITVCDVDVSHDVSGLRRLCREVEQPVLVVSPPATGAGVRRALDAGAAALVFDSELELTLVATVRAVASGQSVVPRKFRASVERPTLSHRELQVLALVRQGLTNAEIAKRLYLAESTIKSHLGSIFTKFGVHSRKEATAVFADLELTSGAVAAPFDQDPPEQATA
jgi:DNA-binding NarL/FixJ family response regulator